MQKKCVYDPLAELLAYIETNKTELSQKNTNVDSNLSIEEKLKKRIIDGNKINIEQDLNTALETYKPLEIINTILLEGMKVVGELFGSGEMQLPFVLQSAETMKTAVAFLEPFMEKTDAQGKGRMTLATVKGDVHDIGKNLVDIILSNNGYTIYNLGIKQTIEQILQNASENKVNAIGMSGLLVKSTLIMKENLEIMNERGIDIPVILGGAALTRKYVEEDLSSIYKGKVYYATDAFDGLHLMNVIMGYETQKEVKKETLNTTNPNYKPKLVSTRLAQKNEEKEANYVLSYTHDIPNPPFWGTKVVTNVDLSKIYPYINTVALFKGQWQMKKGAKTEPEYLAFLQSKAQPIFERLKKQCITEKLLQPAYIYGYYPCQSEKNDVIIYDEKAEKEIARFTFPRQKHGRKLCISDFFMPVNSGKMDVIGIQVVTMGEIATEYSQKLFKNNEFTEYLYFHGFAVEVAEALAESLHQQIRRELSIHQQDSKHIRDLFMQGYRGSRYSFGYPACPNLEDQVPLFELLQAHRIGLSLSDSFQIVPEQSTSAIVVHHPQARYFNV
jgi:5-methyltetrahydrofolate--homocysteine methyltransferase